MALGPEFIRGLEARLNQRLPWRAGRVEGGETWVAVKVSCGELWLILSWGAGAAGCCMAGAREVEALKEGAPARAPMAEALKSRLVRGEIVSVRQLQNDRVLEFALSRRVAAGTLVNYFLVLEATEPVANLVLLNDSRRIEEAARHSAPDQNHYRTLLPGHPYTPPPVFNGPLPQDFLKNNLKSNFKFEDVMNLAGIGRPLARLIQSRWEERDPDTWLAALCGAETDARLPCYVIGKNYLTRFGLSLVPEGRPVTTANGEEQDALDAAARGVLEPLLHRGRERQVHEIDAKLKRAVKARERHRDGLLKQLRDCEAANLLRKKGEMLLACLADVPPYASEVTLTNWEGETLAIELDPRLSPSKNAERYFKKYRRAKGDPDAIRQQILELEGSIREIKEQHDLLESIEAPEKFREAALDLEAWLSSFGAPSKQDGENKNKKIKLKSKARAKDAGKKYVPPHASLTMDGLTILVGLSARGNRYVTFRQARPEDIWLHAHELPGAHVIIRGARDRAELEGEHRPVLEFAAALAAGHSKGRNSGSVSVDYTERRHVRSVPGTVSLVTYVNPGTLRVAPRTL